MAAPKLAQHQLFKGTHPLAEAKIGDDVGSLEFLVTEEMIERNAWANDDYNPWYMEDSPYGGRIASPIAALAYDGTLFYDYYKFPEGGNLMAKQEFEFIEPLRPGVKYKMSGKLIEMYKKKGRTFYRLGIEITAPDGKVVQRMVKTNASPVKPEPEAKS